MTDAQENGLSKATDAVMCLLDGESVDNIMAKFNGGAEKSGKH